MLFKTGTHWQRFFQQNVQSYEPLKIIFFLVEREKDQYFSAELCYNSKLNWPLSKPTTTEAMATIHAHDDLIVIPFVGIY